MRRPFCSIACRRQTPHIVSHGSRPRIIQSGRCPARWAEGQVVLVVPVQHHADGLYNGSSMGRVLVPGIGIRELNNLSVVTSHAVHPQHQLDALLFSDPPPVAGERSLDATESPRRVRRYPGSQDRICTSRVVPDARSSDTTLLSVWLQVSAISREPRRAPNEYGTQPESRTTPEALERPLEAIAVIHGRARPLRVRRCRWVSLQVAAGQQRLQQRQGSPIRRRL